ncbi:MAG: 50S ribosomal protein L6 [Candidatus Kaiserbacteria bacterium]|nr:50S ribosomal protein L6 [Candidatus Kaiserbacteria bacterium]
MSRIGKQVITIPSGVEVSFADQQLTVKGPKGELSRPVRDEVTFSVDGETLTAGLAKNTRLGRSLWGTFSSHAKNMIIGVTEGYKKDLEIIGVGYRAEVKGTKLVLTVGFSHPVELDIPEGLQVAVNDAVISVTGSDKELVGLFASHIRQVRKPEPYKGKGIRYVDEYVRRKQGKRAEATA